MSRRWAGAAQPLLFQNVVVALQNEHGASWTHVSWGFSLLSVWPAEDPLKKTWRTFEAFVLSSPHLYKDTHTLRIGHTPKHYGKMKERSILLQPSLMLDLHALASLLVRLKRLKTLVLDASASSCHRNTPFSTFNSSSVQ